MNNYSDKTIQGEHQAAAHVSQKGQAGASVALVDNRPAAIARKRLQEAVGSSGPPKNHAATAAPGIVQRVKKEELSPADWELVNSDGFKAFAHKHKYASKGPAYGPWLKNRPLKAILKDIADFRGAALAPAANAAFVPAAAGIPEAPQVVPAVHLPAHEEEAAVPEPLEEDFFDDALQAPGVNDRLAPPIPLPAASAAAAGRNEHMGMEPVEPLVPVLPAAAAPIGQVPAPPVPVKEEIDTNRIGKEIELTSLTLVGKGLTNGIVLADTAAQELELPVLKIETEGCDRGSPTVELVYGPLPVNEYKSKNFIRAKQALYKVLSTGDKKKLAVRLTDYNAFVGDDSRYTLRIRPGAGVIDSAGKSPKTNIQTNVLVPFAELGNPESDVMKELFTGEKSAGMFAECQGKANKVAALVTSPPAENIISLFTQILYHDAMYGSLRMKRGEENKGSKHHFHVMMKFSPADVVFSILNNGEINALHAWLETIDRSQFLAFVGTFKSLSMPDYQKYTNTATGSSFDNLKQMVAQRRGQAAQALGGVTDDNPVSAIAGGPPILHQHPRPSNRIPIINNAGTKKSHVVIEQRTGTHHFNRGE